MRVLRTPAELSEWTEAARREGRRVGLVPTMGFLHRGHLSLMEACRGRADLTAVSIFVNPTQFGPNEDLARYPRDLEGDLKKCRETGVDVVFAPESGAMYPAGHRTFVEVANAKYEGGYYSEEFLDPAANATVKLTPEWAFALRHDDFAGSPTKYTF